MEIEKGIEEIYRLIKEEAAKDGENLIVDKAKALEALKDIQSEITTKYNETIKLWKQSVKLYEDFIKKAPGSQQMSAPTAKPTLPSSVDIVKGYIDMFKSLSEEKVTLPTTFISIMYLDSIRGVSDMRAARDKMAVSVSGLTSAFYVGTG